MATIHLISLFILTCLVFVSGRNLNFREGVHYFTHGAAVGYHVTIEKCETNLPFQIPGFSFGNVIDNARVYYATDSDWWMHFSTKLYVNGSNYNIKGPVSRLTEAFFTGGGEEADFNLSDFNIETKRLLLSGTIHCEAKKGGIQVTTQTDMGREINTLQDVKTSLETGFNVRYHVNILKCGPVPSGFTGTVGWAGRISGHQLSRDGNVEFTQLVELPTATFVMDVTLYPNRTVLLYVDSVIPDTRKSTGIFKKECLLGSNGSFHIFRI